MLPISFAFKNFKGQLTVWESASRETTHRHFMDLRRRENKKEKVNWCAEKIANFEMLFFLE
jgi:hypothetical protein